jgi:PAS domain S-box-containing protein
MLTVALDISERVEAFQALDDAVRELQEAQRVGRVGSWEWLPATGALSWTDEMFRIWGMDPATDSPTYDRFLLTIPEPDRSQMVDLLSAALAGPDASFRVDHRLTRGDGSELRIQCRGQIERDAAGRVLRVTGSSQDVTELRTALEAMGASEERYRLAAAVTNDVLYDYLVTGDRVSWNPAMTTTFGHPLESDGTTSLVWWTALIHPEDRARVEQSLECAIAAGNERWQEEYRFRRADGQYALVLDRAYVMRDDEGRARRLIGSMIDETARRALDARLRQSAKLDALGTLAGGIAHDFNNILTGILGYAELAAHDLPAQTDAGDAVRKILASSQRARDLVRRILTFSRRDESRRERVSLSDLVDETHELVRATLPSTLRMEVVVPRAASLHTMGDPGMLQQALVNLCVNAEHAMRGREDAVLTLRLAPYVLHDDDAQRRGIRPGAYALISVRDNGTGMPPHVAERVFEPFFTTKPVGEGTGLGLAMVHGAVTAAGGAVDVTTAPGLGTEITLLLPRA